MDKLTMLQGQASLGQTSGTTPPHSSENVDEAAALRLRDEVEELR